MFITYFDNPFVTACAAPPPLAQGRLSRVIIPVRQRMRGFLAHARNDGRQGTRHNFGCASCAACGGEQSGGRSPQRPMRGKILACGSILTMQRTRRSRSKNPLVICVIPRSRRRRRNPLAECRIPPVGKPTSPLKTSVKGARKAFPRGGRLIKYTSSRHKGARKGSL